MSRRLLAVHAHPDDESSKGAATYAHYVHSGARVVVVSCTGGERGDVQNPGLVEQAMAERDITGLRRIEMARAQAVLGFEHRWLGFEDSGMPEEGEPLPPNCFALIPLEHSAEPLVKIIREVRPHVMITYDEAGGYPHPDHIRTHEVSMYAMAAAADPTRYPHTGAAWQIQKVYYDRIFNPPRAKAMLDAFAKAEPDSPRLAELEGMMSRMSARPDLATTHVEVADFLEHRDEALRSHASQVSPDSTFFFWPNDLQREVWPWEDFQLATSLVPSDVPENDLFAGIATDAETE